MTVLAELLLSRQAKRPVAPAVEEGVSAPVQQPVEKLSISAAAARTGISRDTIYRLYKAGFIKGWMPSPKKVLIDADDLMEFFAASAQPGFWTRERKARYNEKAIARKEVRA